MPALLEVFGFSSVLKAYDTFDTGKAWHIWLAYAANGAIMIAAGVLWAVFRKRISEWWPWNQLRATRAELALLSQENFDLRRSLNSSNEPLLLPSSLPAYQQAISALIKPQHNVQFRGFEFFENEPDIPWYATLLFQNVRSTQDQLLGKFELPHLRALYYDNSTGQELADLGPLTWLDSENGPTEINASGSYAIVAQYFQGRWSVSETFHDDVYGVLKIHKAHLPAGDIRITAMLSGSYNLYIPPVKGILILTKDGTASFQTTTDQP